MEASALLSCNEGVGLNRLFLDLGCWLEDESVLGLGGEDFVADVEDKVAEVGGTGDVDRTLSLMEGPPPSGLLGDGMGLVVLPLLVWN